MRFDLGAQEACSTDGAVVISPDSVSLLFSTPVLCHHVAPQSVDREGVSIERPAIGTGPQPGLGEGRPEVEPALRAVARELWERLHDEVLPSTMEALGYDPGCLLEVRRMWSSVLGPGERLPLQCHPGSRLSGLYCLRAPEGSGELVLLRDPIGRQATYVEPELLSGDNDISADRWTIPASPGLLLLFPGYVQHTTEVHRASQAAALIAFETTLAWDRRRASRTG